MVTWFCFQFVTLISVETFSIFSISFREQRQWDYSQRALKALHNCLMSPGTRYREAVNGTKTGSPMTFQSMTRHRMCQKHKKQMSRHWFFFMWPRNMQQSHTHASSIWQHRIWDIPPYAGLTYRMMRPISFHLDFVFSFINCIRHRISQYSALLLLITQAMSRDAVFWFAVSPQGTTPKEQAKQINWMSRNADSGKLELSIL